MTIEGDRYELPLPFLVLATQNPVDLEGTYPLPEAQIDRFLVRVAMAYPSARDEAQMLRAHGVAPPTRSPVLAARDVVALQAIAARIYVEDDLLEYAVGITSFTRATHAWLSGRARARPGADPGGEGHAMLAGRPFVAPDDMRAWRQRALAHRMVLSGRGRGRAEGPRAGGGRGARQGELPSRHARN